jgi:uridine phosphorylase
MIRFGTCGGISRDSIPGSVVVATDGAGLVTRNYDHFLPSSITIPMKRPIEDFNESIHSKPYHFHKIVESDAIISSLLKNELMSRIDDKFVQEGLNITADSFYSSQGRIDDNFNDENKNVIDSLLAHYPNATTLEMETYQLFYLAKCSKKKLAVSAATVVVANRWTGEVVHEKVLDEIEQKAGLAIMKAICQYDL